LPTHCPPPLSLLPSPSLPPSLLLAHHPCCHHHQPLCRCCTPLACHHCCHCHCHCLAALTLFVTHHPHIAVATAFAALPCLFCCPPASLPLPLPMLSRSSLLLPLPLLPSVGKHTNSPLKYQPVSPTCVSQITTGGKPKVTWGRNKLRTFPVNSNFPVRHTH
jgi:hypothetical protein